MYFKRKIDLYLEKWFHKQQHNSLIITGARQIGKTFSILEFANKHYESVIYINFAESPKYKIITTKSYEVNDVISEIKLLNRDFTFKENKTIIFFDEIQEHIDIISTLKFFTLDKRYDVICSGSLLGVVYNKASHIGVGYYDTIKMQPMDFEEFLWANKISEEQINNLEKNLFNLTPLSPAQHHTFSQLFYNYTVLGGYPRVLVEYIKNGYSNILDIQRLHILNTRDDFLKYAQGVVKFKLLEVFESIPFFLAKENKSFTYSYFRKKSDYFDGIFGWLNEAGIVNICKRINRLEKPLAGFTKENGFKLYLNDTGLLVSLLDEDNIKDLYTIKNYHIYKGGVYENLIASILIKQNIPLYYFKNDKSTIEIDFIITSKDYIVPIEVKATSNKSKSLKELLTNKEKYPNIFYAIKLSANNIEYKNNILNLPHYLAFKIKELVNNEEFIKKLNLTDK